MWVLCTCGEDSLITKSERDIAEYCSSGRRIAYLWRWGRSLSRHLDVYYHIPVAI